MNQPSRMVLALVGIAVSFIGLRWLLAFLTHQVDVSDRIEVVAAIFCGLAVLIASWALPCASLARWRQWSPRASYMLGALSFLIPAAALMYFAKSDRYASIMLVPMSFSGMVCRKITYPHLTYEQATAPEPPLSLLSK
jgi:hypothetical protein